MNPHPLGCVKVIIDDDLNKYKPITVPIIYLKKSGKRRRNGIFEDSSIEQAVQHKDGEHLGKILEG